MTQLDIKLNALLTKDVDEIVAGQTIIPGLTVPYTKKALQDWIQIRVDIINKLKTSADKTKDYADTKATMSLKDKAIATVVENEGSLAALIGTADDYNKVVEVILYNLAL